MVKKVIIWVAKGDGVPVYHKGAEKLDLGELNLLLQQVKEWRDEEV